MTRLLGTTLNERYRLEATVGSGGMSTVYRARDVTLQREVAVKVMHQEMADQDAQLERFSREARAVAQISDPRVVGVIDAGEDGGQPYIVLEYVEGETLSDRIHRQGRLDIDEALTAAIEIAHALQAAHVRGIVHRDVKPQNVLVSSAGAIKVTDFGIARTREEDGLTADGRVVGTTDYVSPEQASGEPVTAQSDMYSLGIVLYEMVTGSVPFKGETQVAVAMKHINEPLPDPRVLRPEVSARLARVIAISTAKDPEARFAGDGQLIAELNRALAAELGELSDTGQVTADFEAESAPRQISRPVKPVNRRRRLAVIGSAALALLVVAAVAVVALRHNNSGHPGTSAPTTVSAVALCSSCATAYNPYGLDGDTAQNNASAPLAIDGSTNTAWQTQQYFGGTLGKAGVGIYVDAGSAVSLARLQIITTTQGFDATIYGTNQTPSATSFTDSNWQPLAQVNSVAADQTVALSGSYRYVLLWITRLPPDSKYVSIAELRLYKSS